MFSGTSCIAPTPTRLPTHPPYPPTQVYPGDAVRLDGRTVDWEFLQARGTSTEFHILVLLRRGLSLLRPISRRAQTRASAPRVPPLSETQRCRDPACGRCMYSPSSESSLSPSLLLSVSRRSCPSCPLDRAEMGTDSSRWRSGLSTQSTGAPRIGLSRLFLSPTPLALFLSSPFRLRPVCLLPWRCRCPAAHRKHTQKAARSLPRPATAH